MSKSDYCSSLFTDLLHYLLNKLQRTQNNASRRPICPTIFTGCQFRLRLNLRSPLFVTVLMALSKYVWAHVLAGQFSMPAVVFSLSRVSDWRSLVAYSLWPQYLECSASVLPYSAFLYHLSWLSFLHMILSLYSFMFLALLVCMCVCKCFAWL